mmetsp:Transcript_26784/g.62229  ORF Transcript_26784/g.62229 Transcript_26784/m.62229 type:complete len:255 (+) Transcript_26784:1648-2412(+)
MQSMIPTTSLPSASFQSSTAASVMDSTSNKPSDATPYPSNIPSFTPPITSAPSAALVVFLACPECPGPFDSDLTNAFDSVIHAMAANGTLQAIDSTSSTLIVEVESVNCTSDETMFQTDVFVDFLGNQSAEQLRRSKSCSNSSWRPTILSTPIVVVHVIYSFMRSHQYRLSTPMRSSAPKQSQVPLNSLPTSSVLKVAVWVVQMTQISSMLMSSWMGLFQDNLILLLTHVVSCSKALATPTVRRLTSVYVKWIH